MTAASPSSDTQAVEAVLDDMLEFAETADPGQAAKIKWHVQEIRIQMMLRGPVHGVSVDEDGLLRRPGSSGSDGRTNRL